MNQAPTAPRGTRHHDTRGFRIRSPRRILFPAAAAVAIASILALAGAPLAGESGDAAHRGHHGSAMTDAAMRAHAEAYWASHRPVGASPLAPQGTLAATFTVGNFFFDIGSPAQVDTARILVGETVAWQWVAGFHTVTNGTNGTDPDAGTLFNQPSDSANPLFTYTYTSAGTYPFFCAFHELQNMFGVVIVSTTTAVGPPPGRGTLGFTRDPAPNPSRSGFRFEYALSVPGRALAEVFDPGGRRVAVLVDGDLPAGTFAASWDGRAIAGAARAGVYYVRLRLPGYDESRRVVVRR